MSTFLIIYIGLCTLFYFLGLRAIFIHDVTGSWKKSYVLWWWEVLVSLFMFAGGAILFLWQLFKT